MGCAGAVLIAAFAYYFLVWAPKTKQRAKLANGNGGEAGGGKAASLAQGVANLGASEAASAVSLSCAQPQKLESDLDPEVAALREAREARQSKRNGRTA